MMNPRLMKRLMLPRSMQRLAVERLTEPIHLNLASVFVALFGSFRQKINFDLIIRNQFAFSILSAADQAARLGLRRVSLVEFGVFHGAGLANMHAIASEITKMTGVGFELFGFDTGEGMPPAQDYRDHPELWQEGDYTVGDAAPVRSLVPPDAHLLIGDIAQTMPEFLHNLTPEAPLGFASLDVDYYSSSKKALEVFKSSADKYLPTVILYLDDISADTANPWCGELLAVNEFNEEMAMRKIAPFPLLRSRRIFKNARWIDQTHVVHIFDHRARTPRHLPAAEPAQSVPAGGIPA